MVYLLHMRKVSKNLLIAVVIGVFSFASCNRQQNTGSKTNGKDTVELAYKLLDSISEGEFEKDKWLSVTEQSALDSEAMGFVPSKENLEKKLKKEFSNIDPLEYYLSVHPSKKFTNRKEMVKKYKKLKKLIHQYNDNYYDLGHVAQRRNNMDVLLSLVNNHFALENYATMDTKFTYNTNIVSAKLDPRKKFDLSGDDYKSLLNDAVQLISNSDNSKAEELIDYIIVYCKKADDYLVCYNKALVRSRYQDYNAAIYYAKESVKIRKDFYLGYLLIGDCFLEQGMIDKAHENYILANKIKDNVVSIERLAYTSMLLEEGKNVEAYYSKILEKYTAGTDRYQYMANHSIALVYNQKFDEAMEEVRKIKAVHKDWPITYLTEAYIQLYKNKFDEAEKLFSKVVVMGDKFYGGVGLALTNYCKRNYLQSSYLFKGLEGKSDYRRLSRIPSILLFSGYSYANTEDYFSSCVKLQNYATTYKKNDAYYIGTSMCAYGLRDYFSAEQTFDSASIQRNNLTQYFCLKGTYLFLNKKYTEAPKYFQLALKSDSTNLSAINGLGSAHIALEEFDDAVKCFDNGISKASSYPYFYFNKANAIFSLARLKYESEQKEQAKKTIDVGVELMRKSAELRSSFEIDINLGNAFSFIEDTASALMYYNNVNHLGSLNNIGVMYAKLGAKERAKSIWDEIVKKDSTLLLPISNLKTLKVGDKTSTSGKSKFKSFIWSFYYKSYEDVKYHWTSKYPVFYNAKFEPLVPLGFSDLVFTEVSDADLE